MAIFLDTGKIEEIKKYHEMGIIRGVTTNPTILVKDGVTGGMEGVKKRSIAIAKLIQPLPLSVEVTSNDMEKIDQILAANAKKTDQKPLAPISSAGCMVTYPELLSSLRQGVW